MTSTSSRVRHRHGVAFGMGVLLILILIFLNISISNANRIKIRKCCSENQVIDIYRMKCRNSGNSIWSPRFYQDRDQTNDRGDGMTSYEFASGIPRCPQGVGVHIFPLKEISHLAVQEAKFRLHKTGRITAQHSSGDWIDVPDNTCIDGIMNYGQNDIPSSFTGDEIDQAIITCPVN